MCSSKHAEILVVAHCFRNQTVEQGNEEPSAVAAKEVSIFPKDLPSVKTLSAQALSETAHTE